MHQSQACRVCQPRRFATETYFNATDPEQNLRLYNNIYGAQLGMTESWDEVLDREANRVLQSALLQVRHDPHMFHQVGARQHEL